LCDATPTNKILKNNNLICLTLWIIITYSYIKIKLTYSYKTASAIRLNPCALYVSTLQSHQKRDIFFKYKTREKRFYIVRATIMKKTMALFLILTFVTSVPSAFSQESKEKKQSPFFNLHSIKNLRVSSFFQN
jgi:hypothetical protein